MDQKIYELLSRMSSELPETDALIILFKYLQEIIPFDNVACFLVDRETKIFTCFLEYSSSRVFSKYYYKKDFILSQPEIDEYLGSDFSKILIVDSTSKVPIFAKYLEDFTQSGESNLIAPIFMDKEKRHNIHVAFYAKKARLFKDKHRETIVPLMPLLKELVMTLYQNNLGESISLSPNGKFASVFEERLSSCPDLISVMQAIRDVAEFDSTVLIHGETGSGKEIAAEAIHALSQRKEHSFVRVNCGSIPETLIESEFFGFEKGAFTGANHLKRGYFEQAHKGTIYLDEIGELSPNAQVRLLRVLENREISRVGSEKSIKIDIRIVAASNKNLWEMVLANQFREDLYYRLCVFPIYIPPLRERKKDLPVLVKYFYNFYTQKFYKKTFPKLSERNLYQLAHYDWPGNVRQLRHAIERALIMGVSNKFNELDFGFLSEQSRNSVGIQNNPQKEEIEKALKLSNGKIQGARGAAELLNIHPATLRSRMRVLGIPFSKKDMQKIHESNAI